MYLIQAKLKLLSLYYLMNIIELHQDLIDTNNIHQFSIITGEYLYEIMRTYYLPTTEIVLFLVPAKTIYSIKYTRIYRMDYQYDGF